MRPPLTDAGNLGGARVAASAPHPSVSDFFPMLRAALVARASRRPARPACGPGATWHHHPCCFAHAGQFTGATLPNTPTKSQR